MEVTPGGGSSGSSDNNKKQQQPKKGGGGIFKAPIPVPSSNNASCSTNPFAGLEKAEKDPNDSKTTAELPTSTTPDDTPKAKPAPKKTAAAAPRKKKTPDCPAAAAAAPAPAQVDADPENAENIEPQPERPPPVKKPRVRTQKKVEAEAETPESAVEAIAEKPPVLKKSRKSAPKKKAVSEVPPVLEAETGPLSTDGENQDLEAADPYCLPNEAEEMETQPKRKRAKRPPKEHNLSAEVLKDYDDTIEWVVKHWQEDPDTQEQEELESQCSPKAQRSSCSSPPSIDVSPKSESISEAESSGVDVGEVADESEEMDEFAFSQLSQAPAPVGGISGVPALVGGH